VQAAAGGRGKENQQLLARQLLKTKSEIVFGSSRNSNDDCQQLQMSSTAADKQLAAETGQNKQVIDEIR